MDRLLATLASVLPSGEPPEWIQLVPIGAIPTIDGRGPYKLPDQAAAQAVVKVSMAGNRPLPIDYDHAIDMAARGNPLGNAPAAGWIEELQARADGIWGRVTWTERGAASIKGLEYRFISPTFYHDKTGGQVRQIVRAALTNNPNFSQLPALASQGGSMENLLAALIALLKLPPTADQQAVLDAVKQLVGEEATTAASVKGIAAVMGLPETAALAEIKGAIVARNAALAKSAGLAETASVAEIDKALATAAATARASGDNSKAIGELNAQIVSLQSQLATLQGTQAKNAAETAADEAIKTGKIVPALRDWAIAYASSDAQGFKTYVDNMPVVLQPGTAIPAGAPAGGDGLSATDIAICSQMGIKPEDYKKTKAQEAR